MGDSKNLGSVSELEKEVQHTPKEIMQQTIEAVLLAAQGRLLSAEAAQFSVEIFREIIHWSFSKDGMHPTPVEIVKNTLDSMPGVGINFGMTPAGKPKLDA